jgi:hypothetical protein
MPYMRRGQDESNPVSLLQSPTEKSPELGNLIKLGTTRYGKSSAEFDTFHLRFLKCG